MVGEYQAFEIRRKGEGGGGDQLSGEEPSNEGGGGEDGMAMVM